MFGKRLKLFKLFGFEVGVDLSWIIIAILIAWSLSTGYFPFQIKDLSTRTYWMMGIVGAAGLFFSIIAHEFCHSLVAGLRVLFFEFRYGLLHAAFEVGNGSVQPDLEAVPCAFAAGLYFIHF